jgi:hypothetical protein
MDHYLSRLDDFHNRPGTQSSRRWIERHTRSAIENAGIDSRLSQADFTNVDLAQHEKR